MDISVNTNHDLNARASRGALSRKGTGPVGLIGTLELGRQGFCYQWRKGHMAASCPEKEAGENCSVRVMRTGPNDQIDILDGSSERLYRSSHLCREVYTSRAGRVLNVRA